MCVAVPLQVLSIEDQMARVGASGVEMEVGLQLVDEEVAVGDYVIVHAGFAISRLSAEEAEETLVILQRLEASWQSKAE